MTIPIQKEVRPNFDLQYASELLQSVAYSGCYALVAEYAGAGPPATVGLLGHYFPTHLDRMCRDYQDVHQQLVAMGYSLSGAYVFHHATTTQEARAYIEAPLAELRRMIPAARYEIYSGNNLVLNYWVQRRQFFFGNTFYRFPAGIAATFDLRRGVTGHL